MTESVNRIAVISSLSGDGSGLAQKRERSKRQHRDEEHDTVEISAEARSLSTSEETEENILTEDTAFESIG
jgi:hypothetical protein